MKQWLIALLCCPTCRNDLILEQPIFENGEIKSGHLSCKKCDKSYDIHNFIPRFTTSDKYVGNFSFEWNRHATLQYGKLSEDTFECKTGILQTDVKDKLVLDAGCGGGRFCDVISRNGGKVIGVDLSYSVDAAFNEIGSRDNVSLVQCDLLKLPFKPDVFDISFSIGVLHHTRAPRKAAMEMARVTNDIMAIWVYASWKESRSRMYTRASYAVSNFYRLFSVRMSSKRLYHLLRRLAFTRQLRIRYFWNLVFRSSEYLDLNKWLLDTFDWYSPKYQYKYTYDEVKAWFIEFGFSRVERLPYPVSIKARSKNINQNLAVS